ncbi:MAG: hypothetical protein NKF70_12335 [Methanobacterium sp. ERen5]|nr:MAG: hypothetical protein NKF70_12335 [Methanobacterium sp. ERen5]
MEKIKSQIYNYELTTNNTQCYKDLQNQYKNCSNSNKTLTLTEASMKKLNLNLKKKQKHTKNCINALKSIKKAENIPESIQNYKQNMKSLGVLNNNMTTEIQKNQDVIERSNNPTKEVDNSVKGTEFSNTKDQKIDELYYYGIGFGSIGACTLTGAVVFLEISDVLYSKVLLARAARNLLINTARNSATAALAAGQVADAITYLNNVRAITAVPIPYLNTLKEALFVSKVLIAITAVCVVIVLAVTIAWFGYKNYWW